MKYTPWKRSGLIILDATDRLVADARMCGPNEYGLWKRNADLSGPELEANARLIAAAPDLLAALHSFVGYYEQAGIGPCEDGHDDDDDRGPFSGDERYNVREARAAIAKAE